MTRTKNLLAKLQHKTGKMFNLTNYSFGTRNGEYYTLNRNGVLNYVGICIQITK